MSTFGYTRDEPIFGSWQGATKSVVSWVLTSSIIQEIHSNEVKGATFESTDGATTVNQSTVGFVDDDNNCVTRRRERRAHQISSEECSKMGMTSVLDRRHT